MCRGTIIRPRIPRASTCATTSTSTRSSARAVCAWVVDVVVVHSQQWNPMAGDIRVQVLTAEHGAVTTVSGDLDMVAGERLDAALNEIADDTDVLLDLSAVEF